MVVKSGIQTLSNNFAGGIVGSNDVICVVRDSYFVGRAYTNTYQKGKPIVGGGYNQQQTVQGN